MYTERALKHQLLALTALTLTVTLGGLTFGINQALHISELTGELEELRSQEPVEILVEQSPCKQIEEPKTEVILTNYYPGDATNSSSTTGSGLSTKHFAINEHGWYTYYGKVVVAAATYQGLESNYGVLADYMEEDQNIIYYDYFDTFNMEIDGKTYNCIVLDTCGASMELQSSDQGLNRIDIYISDRAYAFGKRKATIE